MGNITTALRLLPMLIKIAEIVHGARQGSVKKELVLTVIYGLLQVFFPGVPLAELKPHISDLVDGMVEMLTELGALPPHAPR